jgi:nitrite reductase (cytochrome c-552)
MRSKTLFYLLLMIPVSISSVMLIHGCSPDKPEPVRISIIPDNEYDPSKWGEVYPLEYESWLKTRDPRPAGKSKYKKGWDNKTIYDKLSEYPYLAAIFNGFGFGIEYNEPRGHYYMMTDQVEVDKSRVKPGGACLTCKSPFISKLINDNGNALYSMQYADSVKLIPEKFRSLGASCIDCHSNKNMEIRTSRWTISEGLKTIGKEEISRQEARTVICAQCHVTYIIPRDDKMQPTGVIFPWKKGKWGDISIENIISQIKSSPSYVEWTQSVTGFKLGFIRHPEFEFFTRDSVHFKAGLSCADCHMPYIRTGVFKISDHNLMSPLKNDLKACANCHPQARDRLKEDVIAIQDRTASLLNRAGYAVSTATKLFEAANNLKGTADTELYKKAKDHYIEAFYRLIFIGAENSMGFHNPSEAGRILGDSIAFAYKSEALLRQAVTKAGMSLPPDIGLDLLKYLNNRGTKKLNFIPRQELPDPFGIQELLVPRSATGI